MQMKDGERSDLVVPQSVASAKDHLAAGSLTTIGHICIVCRGSFPYRYTGSYRVDTLHPVDFVCRTCFGEWYRDWEIRSGWNGRAER